MNFPKILILTSCIVLSAPNLFAVQTKAATHGSTAATDQKAIASAMSAAPKKVAAAATIVAMGKDGKMHTLRKGHNNFTCMPDNPATPGPDPMCMDKALWNGQKPGWVTSRPKPVKLALCTCWKAKPMPAMLILMLKNQPQATIGSRPAPMS